MISLINIKRAAGVVTMAACWLVTPFLLLESPAATPNNAPAPAPLERFECEAHAVESALELPSESDITGIDLLLFEPLPDIKAIVKKNTTRKKKKKGR